MKKCDFHIHTVPTISDSAFTFSLNALKGYVEKMELDAIAITNHNVFDMSNYLAIRNALPDCQVLPGVEVDLEGGHILVVSSQEDVEVYDFSVKCDAVKRLIKTSEDTLSLDEFTAIFQNLSKYVLIPHYDKTPSLLKSVIASLSDYIYAGEVTSIKKFLYMQKDNQERLTPVLFSDFRFSDNVCENDYPVRQTYLDINEITINSLNICLRDKSNATLSANDGNRLFKIFSNGQMLSTGLNIMYGRRSSGKTWNLNKIYEQFGDRAKYIRQFELLRNGQQYSIDQFEVEQKTRLEGIVLNYFKPFKEVVEDITQMPTITNDEMEVEDYLKALVKRSELENLNDVFSNALLYDEIPFKVGGTKQIRKIIDAVISLLETQRYQDIVQKYISESVLKSLLKELIEKFYSMENSIKCKDLTNSILLDVQSALQLQTALPSIPNINLYEIAKRQLQRKKFVSITRGIKKSREIYREKVQKFSISLKTVTFANATEVKAGHGLSASLVGAYYYYNDPLNYLYKLIEAGIDTSKLYKLFVGIKYNILNENGYHVSGGEMSEFTFLQKIKDARTKDILLIDEPESSFDNMFLKKDINKFIKETSELMPVVISTHNNTIGGSIHPDYILYTEKKNVDGKAKFMLYSGYATDKTLSTIDGDRMENYQVTIESLEAGEDAYIQRQDLYGKLKD